MSNPDLDADADAGTETDLPTSAGLYDYFLGGVNNTEADRLAGERLIEKMPEVRDAAWANRGFLGRVVRWLAADRGIRQFIDIGPLSRAAIHSRCCLRHRSGHQGCLLRC